MTEPDLSTTDRRLRRLFLLIVIASFVLTPVASPDIWWQLSRGQTVMADLSAPGPILAAGDPVSEADWLGGLPFFLSWMIAGFSGLMLLKFFGVGLLLYLMMRRYESQLKWVAFALVLITLLAANTAWQPTPRLLDCWFVFLTWIATARWSQSPTKQNVILVLLSLVAWANLAPLCLLGIGVVAVVPWLSGMQTEPTVTRKQAGLLFASAVLALMLTPRGWYTLSDSLTQLIPALFYAQDLLATTVWQPAFEQGLTIETVGLGILTLVTACYLIFYSTGWIESVAFLVFAVPAWLNADAVPPCSIGIALLLGRSLVAHPYPIQLLKAKEFLSPAVGRLLLIVGLFILSWKAAAGALPGQSQRLGWGVDPELDITLLGQAIGPLDYEGTAHCMDIASAGMLSWIKADHKIRPYLTHRQALVQGRLFDELSLNRELADGWMLQKPRITGDWGGWWVRMKERDCQLLLIPNGDTRTIRALVESRWQPMSVDASVIPFGWSGELLSSPQIVKLLPVKEFLNRKQWTYSLPDPSGTPECADWWGMLTGLPNLKPALLQARTFRAMKLYTAALRVLHPLLQHYDSPEVKREFELCQKELAFQEQLDTGAPSQLRLQAWQQTRQTDEFPLAQAGPGFKGNHSPPDSVSQPLESAIEQYTHGDCSQAIAALTANDSESLYAKAQLLLESGDPDAAAAVFRELIQRHPQDRLVVPSQNMLDSLP
ncbi:tetratricopeptide repeat protein [Gimesia panareensis]|uniref:Tetratricopeptide repeat protein n=1 Tax=Gimesia panareensis TaxID=2527978 RepID=A0A518A7W2_9PLAN|nr:tetratricopeptide repeat protein [Gimesia panareensis]QDT27954.1 hypothetical protein Enr10x_32910 [Gimesia panareensis]QDU50822.1 hypothetical protein Pan110_31820 [Gimesia panareensis]QDV18689.1 hypothetical protein Pan153_33490 [Gimesia panareensis]